MARGTTLTNLLAMLKTEIGYNLTSGVATAQDTELKQLLANMQKWLWAEHNWAFLRTREDFALVAGTRFYSLPATVSIDYPTLVETKWGNVWHPVHYGIGGEQYTVSDPDRSQKLDPARRWQLYSSTQFEIWPVPASTQTLRFWGTSVLGALVAPSDTCTLDDLLIVLFAAAEKLKRLKQPDWQEKNARAQLLFARLKAADKPDQMFTLGGVDELTYRRPTRVVAVAGNTNQ